MTTRKTILLTHALLALGLAVGGCSDDSGEASPTPSLNLDSGLPGVDSSVPQPDAGAGDAATPPTTGQGGCFQGKPTTNTQLLNACAQGCRPFDNAQRLPGFTAGKLPPL